MFGPGEPSPRSRPCAASEHGGSRQTIAKALQLPEDDACLICYEGLGYYLVPEEPLPRPQSFFVTPPDRRPYME